MTLSVIETIWTNFGQNLVFSLRNSVSLSPGLAVKALPFQYLAKSILKMLSNAILIYIMYLALPILDNANSKH